MKSLFRWLISLLLLAALLLLASCSGAPGCPQAGFGSGTACSPGGPGSFGGGGGGGGGSATAAFVYAVDQGGTIDGFALNTTAGSVSPISGYTAPVVPINNGGVGMVVAQKKFLYAGFASTGQLFGWTIQSNGTLVPIIGSPFTATYLASYINGVGQANIISNPAGTLLFVSDVFLGVHVLQISATGSLSEIAGSPFKVPVETPGFLPMNLATDGLGSYLYVSNGTFLTHTATQVAAYVIAGGSSLGTLTPVPGSPFNYPMWHMKGDPSGQFMIGTSGNAKFFSGTDDNNLYVFQITQSGANAGAITKITTQPTTYSPYSIASQSDLVYSFSFNDTDTAFNNIEGHALSGVGSLGIITGSPFGGVGDGTWGQFDQSGALLFVYASYLNTSTNTTVTQLTPLEVATSGALTQPVATFALVTPGFWVVTDQP